MKCLLRYPGGKSRMLKSLAPHLQKLTQGEDYFCEPFVGGGSVALHVARINRDIRIVLNDRDELIAGLWSALAGPLSGVEALIKKLHVKPTVELWEKVKAKIPEDDVERAFKAIFLNRTSYNGMIHGSSPIGGRSQKGKPGAARIWKIDCQYDPDQMALLIRDYHGRLHGRTDVGKVDAIEFMQEFNDWPHFIDPPYFIEDKPSKSLYGVLMTRKEHEILATYLKSCRKWILTYDTSNEVMKTLYRGLDKFILDVKYSSTTSQTGKWKEDSECLVTKGI